MVQKLSLTEKLNTTISGDAKGVGSSSIVGVVENVECRLGHVEFRLFFMVLEGLMPYCILGLDQMRRFKCQVDLDEDVLIFGGKDGVKVPFLSQSEAMMAAYKMIGNGESVAAATDSGQQSGVTGKLKSLFKKN